MFLMKTRFTSFQLGLLTCVRVVWGVFSEQGLVEAPWLWQLRIFHLRLGISRLAQAYFLWRWQKLKRPRRNTQGLLRPKLGSDTLNIFSIPLVKASHKAEIRFKEQEHRLQFFSSQIYTITWPICGERGGEEFESLMESTIGI